MRALHLLLLALVSACGSEEAEPFPTDPPPAPLLPPCTPGQVLLDGHPLPLGHGLATHGLLYDGWAVSLFDTEGVRCEDLLTRSSPKRSQRLELRVQTGLYGGVWLGDGREPNAELTLDQKAQRPGDRVVVCVREPVRIQVGPGPAGPGGTATVQGGFEGIYCGYTRQ